MLDETEEAGIKLLGPRPLFFPSATGYFPARSADYGDDVRSPAGDGRQGIRCGLPAALKFRTIRSTNCTLHRRGGRSMQSPVPTTPIEAPPLESGTSRIGANDIRPVPSCLRLTARRISRGHTSLLFLWLHTRWIADWFCRLWEECRSRAHCSASEHLLSGLVLKLAGRPCSAGICRAVFFANTCTRFWPYARTVTAPCFPITHTPIHTQRSVTIPPNTSAK